MRLIHSGCSCLRNFGTAALMNSVSLTIVMMNASTTTSRSAQTRVRHCWRNGAGVFAGGRRTATGGAGDSGTTAAGDGRLDDGRRRRRASTTRQRRCDRDHRRDDGGRAARR